MLAGDSFILLFLLFWVGILVGPWPLTLVGLGIGILLNGIHVKIIIKQRIQALEDVSRSTGMPLPPHVQAQINELKNQKGFRLWGSLPK